MDKGNPLNQWEVDKWQVRTKGGNKMKKRENISLILAENVRWRGESKFRERKCNFSLDFPAFEPSVRVGLRSKVVLRGKGYAWAPVLWSFDNSKR